MNAIICRLVVFLIFVELILCVKAEDNALIDKVPVETIRIPPLREGTTAVVGPRGEYGGGCRQISVVWHPNDLNLACIYRDGQGIVVESWDAVQGNRGKTATVAGIAQTIGLNALYNEDGSGLVVGGYQINCESGKTTNLLNYRQVDGRWLLPSYVPNAMIWKDADWSGGGIWIATSFKGQLVQSEVFLPKDSNYTREPRLLAVSADGEKVLLMCLREKLIFWYSLKNKKVENSVVMQNYPVCWATNLGGTALATGHSDGTIGTWNLLSMEQFKVLRAHFNGVEDVAFSTDGKTLFGVDRGSLSVWDTETWSKKADINCGGFVVEPSHAASAVAVVSSSGNVEIVDWASSRKKGWIDLPLDEHLKILKTRWYSTKMFMAFSDSDLFTINPIESTVKVKRLVYDSATICKYTPRFFDTNGMGFGIFYDLESGEKAELWRGPSDERCAVPFRFFEDTPDIGSPIWVGKSDVLIFGVHGTPLKSQSKGRYLGLYNVKTRDRSLNPLDDILGLSPVKDWQPLIAVSEDSKMIGMVCPRVVDIVDVAKKKLLHRFDIAGEGQGRGVSFPIFSPDGRFFFLMVEAQQLAGGLVESVKAWDLSSGESVELPEMTKRVRGIAISPDGSNLAVQTDNHIALWAIKNGMVLEDRLLESWFPTGNSYPAALAFSPDGNQLAAPEKGGIRFWSVSKEQK